MTADAVNLQAQCELGAIGHPFIHAGGIVQQQRVQRLGLSKDFEARVVLMSRAYIEYLNLKNSYQMFLNLRREPLVHLEGESLTSLETALGVLRVSLSHNNNPYQKQTIYYIIKAITIRTMSHSKTE